MKGWQATKVYGYREFKQTLLRNSYSRAAIRSVILTYRKLSPVNLFFLPLSKPLENQKFRGYILRSRVFARIFGSNTRTADVLLGGLEKTAWVFGRPNHSSLYRIASLYRQKRQYQKAFNIYFYLFKATHSFRFCTRAILCERELEEKELFEYYKESASSLDAVSYHMLTCEYSKYYDSVVPDWQGIIETIQKDRKNLVLINFSILAALGFMNVDFIDEVVDIIFNGPLDVDDNSMRRTLTMIAAAYYRTGNTRKLWELTSRVSYPNSDWNLYKAFGEGNIQQALICRGETIKASFLRFYPRYGKTGGRKVLVPEKDLCGEAFNALFYASISREHQDVAITCDERLHKILTSNFDNIAFIPKAPRYRQKTEPERFNQINCGLGDFLDNESFRQVRGAEFVVIDYNKHFSDKECRDGLEHGWLRADSELMEMWDKKLRRGEGKKLIGISAYSTVRSRIRDIHMIGVDYWGDIFGMRNCDFVNFSAAIDAKGCQQLERKFNVTILNPEIDLYNDFDNLLAIMSILDYGVLPANNLMDFAAAVGLKTIVFSPSNIMKVWVGNGDNYVFSNNVRFIFPENGENEYDMVSRGVEAIKSDLAI